MIIKNLGFSILGIFISFQTAHSQTNIDTLDHILVNQIGYTPNSQKLALSRIKSSKFEVRSVETGKTVYAGVPGKMEFWQYSGDSVSVLDFSVVSQVGKYQIFVDGLKSGSYVFEIKPNIYNNLVKASMKAFYFNRCSEAIPSEYGGKWARAAGHPDTAVFVHESAASTKRPTGTKISSPSGWYDAGDYNKYIVNSGITTYTLLLFCQMFPEYTASLKLDIPENTNTIPDLLDELLVNLKWMLTMQDPVDGGVYHKLTNKAFDAFVMPDKATSPRYVVQKTTAATADFAAVMAKASVVLKKYKNAELDKLSQTCIDAAKKAYDWAQKNQNIPYKQPEDFRTGQYDDLHLSDELFWAKIEIGLATNQKLIDIADIQAQKVQIPTWDHVEMLGILSLSLSDNKEFTDLKLEATKLLMNYTDKLCTISEQSAYRISIDSFAWGSNSFVANSAMLKLVAYKLSGNTRLMTSAQSDVDYLLGRNATGYCFVSGEGSKSPMFIHHRPSDADGVKEPVPGFLVGGPNTVTFGDCKDEATRSKYPAKAYVDKLCSYSTNEIAINWNAPLFFVVGAMEAMK